MHSPRNEALLSGVAETFRDAVVGFCKEADKLQYQWMGYLPDESVSDEFWRNLKPQIHALLRNTPVLRSWSGRLYRPDRLRFLATMGRDQYGEPLFADLLDEIYLAPHYTFANYQLLEPLGTRRIHVTEFLDRLRADLQKPDSRMKTTLSDNDWHSRIAKLLLTFLPHHATRMRSIPLIPLTDRSWVAATRGGFDPPIHFPTSGPSKIPTDLGFQLVDPDAIKEISRRGLFAQLGVLECEPKDVISAIYREHASGKAKALNVAGTIPHLQFLFSNLPADTRLDRTFYLATEGGGLVDLSTERSYFPDSNDAYDPRSVFQPRDPSGSHYPAKFIHSEYLAASPSKPGSHGMSFRVWLEEGGGVKRIPQIRHASNDQPSAELGYILNHHPEIVLGLLKKNWPHYAGVLSYPIEKRLRESELPGLVGTIRLQGSYMPLPRLKALAGSYGVVDAPFFVHAPSDLRDEDEESWNFLSRFGVRFADDWEFYLKLLVSIASSNEESCSPETEKAIFRVYRSIENKAFTEDGRYIIR